MARRIRLLNHYNIDLIFDIGGNEGQYAQLLRKLGYTGRIVSFEPQSKQYQTLAQIASSDPKWDTVQMAVGNYDGTATLNITKTSVMSSLKTPAAALKALQPYRSEIVATEEVQIRTLHTIIPDYLKDAQNLYIKMDTQGFEKPILDGASRSLSTCISVLELELSMEQYYTDEVLFPDMVQHLAQLGFVCSAIEPVTQDKKSYRLLQVDGIFTRHNQ